MPVAVRRLIIVLLLVVAGSAAFGLTRLSSEPSQPLDSIIESRQPNDGEKILQQSQITIDLLSGWDGKLTIDGIAIPDDQLIKVREQGIIRFQPAKGKALEYFPAGQNCISFTYWQLATGPDQSFTAKPWCFTSV
jgi:hypothetical protein